MTCDRCGLARPERFGVGLRCGCCGLALEWGEKCPSRPKTGGWMVGVIVQGGAYLTPAKSPVIAK